jgi:hypothetical protein
VIGQGGYRRPATTLGYLTVRRVGSGPSAKMGRLTTGGGAVLRERDALLRDLFEIPEGVAGSDFVLQLPAGTG